MQSFLRLRFVAVFAAALVGTASAQAMDRPAPEAVAVDPFALYGPEIRFQVMRNGEPVGKHSVNFTQDGEDLVVTSRLDIAIKLLFVTAYRYSYESVGRWRNGQLHALDAWVDDDGEKTETKVTREGDQLRVAGPKGTFTTGLDTLPTTHWNPRQTSQSRVINTLTGEIDSVVILDRGATEVDGGRGRIPARHFEYTGDLRVETWYDPQGHWVGMRFKAKDGSDIEYFCVDCRGAIGIGG